MQKRIIVVSLQLVLASVFVIGADWASADIKRLFHGYYADIALPFGFYFLLIMLEDNFSFFRPWYSKALAVFLLVSASEILQYFGIYALAQVFDTLDFVAYASGVLAAALIDIQAISRLYPAFHGYNTHHKA